MQVRFASLLLVLLTTPLTMKSTQTLANNTTKLPAMAPSRPYGTTNLNQQPRMHFSSYEQEAKAQPTTSPTTRTAGDENDLYSTMARKVAALLQTAVVSISNSWTNFQHNAYATFLSVTRDMAHGITLFEWTMIDGTPDLFQAFDRRLLLQTYSATIATMDYVLSAQGSSDLLRAVLTPMLQPSPSPLDLRRPLPTITKYLYTALMIDHQSHEHATHMFVDPCQHSKYDLGWPYGLLADRFWQSPHAPDCQPKTQNDSITFWQSPYSFIMSILTNNGEQELYSTYLSKYELQDATKKWVNDELYAILKWPYELHTAVVQWLIIKMESIKLWIIQSGWPALVVWWTDLIQEATARWEEITMSFKEFRFWLSFVIQYRVQAYWYYLQQCTITVTESMADFNMQLIMDYNGGPTMKRSRGNHKGPTRKSPTTQQGANIPPIHCSDHVTSSMSPQDRHEAEVKQVLDAVRKGGWEVHYRVLGIDHTATPNQIKQAYYNRSRQVHTDKNSTPGAKETMLAVNAAYEAVTRLLYVVVVPVDGVGAQMCNKPMYSVLFGSSWANCPTPE